MKKFYQAATAEPVEGSYTVALDGRAIRTPGKAAFLVPSQPLAEAIAKEWDGQEDELDPFTMPLTGLAYAAIDRIGEHRDLVTKEIAAYAETDLLCYRAGAPRELVQKQSDAWQPILDWAAQDLGIALDVVQGITPLNHPRASLDKAWDVLAACSDHALSGLSRLTHITGSVILGLAVLHRRIEAADAYELAHLEDRWQADQWGADEEAEERHEMRRVDLLAAEKYLVLLGE